MERARVGGGSLYRLFPSKDALVNAVFREAKRRLERALASGLDRELPALALDPGHDAARVLDPGQHAARLLFDEFWRRLTGFARSEPVAFRFLELQDHVTYLDAESRAVEIGVLAPIVVACMDLQRRGVFRADLRPDVMIALVWGAFVGLVKAERLGYLTLDDAAFLAARDTCFRGLAASPSTTPLAKKEP